MKKPMLIRFTEKQLTSLRKVAKRLDISVAEVVRQTIDAFFAQKERGA